MSAQYIYIIIFLKNIIHISCHVMSYYLIHHMGMVALLFTPKWLTHGWMFITPRMVSWVLTQPHLRSHTTTHTHTYILYIYNIHYVYTHTYICIYIWYMYMVHICIDKYVYIYMYTYTHTYIYIFEYVRTPRQSNMAVDFFYPFIVVFLALNHPFCGWRFPSGPPCLMTQEGM